MGGRLARPDDDLRTLLTLGSIGTLNDGALLDLFETRKGEASAADRAFETLIARHGGMVLRVARGRLASEEDARDAFQATFWILARRSRTIRDRDALASWLFGVATRVAARASVEAARRRDRERRVAAPVADSTLDPAHSDLDLGPTLQDEVRRLPEKYRAAVVLCDLEGLSNEEAAARLACPVGTLKARLSRARSRLRTRLADRGFAPLGWESAPPPRPLVVPFPLIQAACRMALSTPPSGPLATVIASAAPTSSALSLAQGASRTMILSSIPTWLAVASATLAAGAVAVVGLPTSPTSNQAPTVAARPQPTVIAENILQNPGFEAGDHTPRSWSQGAYVDGVQYLWDRAIGQQGKASLCLTKTARRYFPIAQWYQVVDRKGDEPTLRVAAQVKAEKAMKAIIDVAFLDEKGESIGHEWAAYIGAKEANDPPANHDWKEYAGRAKIPKEAKKIRVGLQVYGPGKVWFDEVRADYSKELAVLPANPGEPGIAQALPVPADPGRNDAKPPELVDKAIRGGIIAAEANPLIPRRVNDLIHVGRSLTDWGDHALATATFRKARAAIDGADSGTRWLTDDPIVRLAESLARNGDEALAGETFGHALDRVQAMPQGQQARSWVGLLSAQVKAQGRTKSRPNIDRSRRFIVEHKADLDPDRSADDLLVQLQALAGDIQAALTVAENLPDAPGTEPLNNKVRLLVAIAGTVQPEDVEPGSKVFDFARRSIAKQKDPSVRAQNLVALIDLLAKLDRFGEVQPMIEGVDADLDDPKVAETVMRVYSNALDEMIFRQYRRKDFDAAKRSALHLVKVFSTHPDNLREAQQTQGAAIALGTLGEDAALNQLVDRLPTDGQKYVCLSGLPIALRFLGRATEAQRYEDRANTLLRKNVEGARGGSLGVLSTSRPGGDWAWWSTRLAEHHAVRGDIEQALSAIEAIPLADQQESLATIGFLLARFGHPAQSLEISRRTTDRETRREIAVQVAVGLIRSGRPILSDLDE